MSRESIVVVGDDAESREVIAEALRAAGLSVEMLTRSEALSRLQLAEADLAVIAHDLNQPLTSVMGYGEVLLRQLGDTSPLAHAARMIISEAERMAKIVRNLNKPPSPTRSNDAGSDG